MPTVEEIYRYLQTLAPLDLQMEFDNSGMLIGAPEVPVSKVLLALDVTDAVVSEARDIGAQLIVSHHPLIFHPIRNLTCSPETEKLYAHLKTFHEGNPKRFSPNGFTPHPVTQDEAERIVQALTEVVPTYAPNRDML